MPQARSRRYSSLSSCPQPQKRLEKPLTARKSPANDKHAARVFLRVQQCGSSPGWTSVVEPSHRLAAAVRDCWESINVMHCDAVDPLLLAIRGCTSTQTFRIRQREEARICKRCTMNWRSPPGRQRAAESLRQRATDEWEDRRRMLPLQRRVGLHGTAITAAVGGADPALLCAPIVIHATLAFAVYRTCFRRPDATSEVVMLIPAAPL